MADKKEVARLEDLAYQARCNLIKLCGAYSGNIHMGGDLSMIDVLTCLYHHTMNVDPKDIQMLSLFTQSIAPFRPVKLFKIFFMEDF